MGGPAIAATEPAYTGLIDTSKPWWKNRRLSFPIQNNVQLMQCITVGLLALNVWIGAFVGLQRIDGNSEVGLDMIRRLITASTNAMTVRYFMRTSLERKPL